VIINTITQVIDL